MNFEALAQDLTDKRQAMLLQRVALSEANLACFNAEVTLSDALSEAHGSNHDEVAIALKYHVVLCTWNRKTMTYTMSFISRVYQ